MKPAKFDYLRPESLDEALAMLSADDGERPIAGGQSLLPLMNLRLARPSALIDVGRLPLRFIEEEPGGLRIGALVTHAELERSPVVRTRAPLLARAAHAVGHLAIRARGTLGGSLAHADPAAEELAAVIALDAELEVRSLRGVRTLRATELGLGPWTTALESDELVVAVRFSAPPLGWGFSEFALRSGDFALAGACVALVAGGLRVAVFGPCPTPRPITIDTADSVRAGQQAAAEVELSEGDDPDWRRALVAHEVETAAAAALAGVL
jgi:CO/xanthine dehydrogenase FAD-binding subunit